MANNFPTIKPSLNLQFAATGILPPDVTFTRASNSGGYYDGKTVSKAEENLYLNSVWAGAVSGTPGTVPTGWTSVLAGGSLAVSGAAIQFTALTGTRQAIAQTTTVVAGQVITASIDVDAASGTGTDAIAIFEVVSGATLTSTTQILVSGGTGRKSLSATCTVGGTIRVRFGAAVDTNAATDCVVTLKAPQLEIRSFATAYTPTTTQAITRFQPKLEIAIANEPVFDHNPVTGEALGLSIFEARTNLLLRSEEFDNAYWTKSNLIITANQVIAPDGTLTADKYIPNGTTATTQLVRTGFGSAAHTASIYAKAGELSSVDVLLNNGANGGRFNLTAGTVTNRGTGTGVIVPVGNGWFRCIAISSVAGTDLRIYAPDSNAYTGDGVSGIFVWGAQLEVGAFATPYIPTVGSTVARSADVAVMTGANFSRWYNAEQGSLFAEYTAAATGRYVFAIKGASFVGDKILNWTNGALTNPDGTITSAIAVAKRAVSYQVNSLKMATNGALNTEDTSVTNGWSDSATMIIGASNNSGGSCMNGYVKSMSYYPIALTSAQLQAVTNV